MAQIHLYCVLKGFTSWSLESGLFFIFFFFWSSFHGMGEFTLSCFCVTLDPLVKVRCEQFRKKNLKTTKTIHTRWFPYVKRPAKVYLQAGGHIVLVLHFKESLMKEISKRSLAVVFIYCVLITADFWASCKGILL